MKWTKELPEKPGFYWVKVGTGKHIVQLGESRHISGLAVRLEGYIMLPMPLFVVDAWAGPITEPEGWA